MGKMKCVLLIFFLLTGLGGYCADTLLMTKLLKRIELLQSHDGTVFPTGIFPAYRTYALNKDRQKADINIFYTGLIAFTLRDIMPALTRHQQLIAKQIIDRAMVSAHLFKNRKGRSTFHFWSTHPPQIFPNSGWMNLFDKQQSLPDDMDDTAIMLLAMAAPDSTVQQVHALMQGYGNLVSGRVKNTFKEYEHIKAYSTWFGKKMPIDFDVSVLSNVLYMVQRYQLPWTSMDSASLNLIVKVIEDKRHLTDAGNVSPHYKKTSIILYHFARLMSIKAIPELERLKPLLITEAEDLLQKEGSFLDKILLSTALLKWGVVPVTKDIQTKKDLLDLIEDEDFSFFIANMSSMLPNPIKNWTGALGLGKFDYFCPAYNHLLVLEYLATSQRMGVNLP